MIRKWAPSVAVVVMTMAAGAQASDYFNGFETNTDGWSGVTRVGSGTNGVPSASGSWHAEVPSFEPFTTWGGYGDTDGCTGPCPAAFPPAGYDTELKIYLDVDAGYGDDSRFDFSSAISTPGGVHRRDFIFSCGFYDDVTTPGSGPGFVCSASNNAPGWPKNPGRSPTVVATATGWYTFRHEFRDNGSGELTVALKVLDSGGGLIKTWTLSDPSDVIGTTVGGNRYGWFAGQQFGFPFLAIDDSRRTSVPVDSDGDGVPDGDDQCADSDLSPTVMIDGCDSGVDNELSVLGLPGCTISDLVGKCADDAKNHGKFVSCVAHLTIDLKKAKTITGKEKGAIQRCAAQSTLP